MPKPGVAYPQVEPGAAALMDRRVAVCPPRATVSRALARAAKAEVVVTGPTSAIRRTELARAAAWGLGRVGVQVLARRGLAAVGPRASEIEVRRLLMRGAPMVLVREARRVLGVVDAERVELARPDFSVTARLEQGGDRADEARLWVLRAAGKLGETQGMRVFAVGGFVRDLLLGRQGPDLDLVVEGDGIALARSLAEELGGSLAVHAGFGTASIEGAMGAAGPGTSPLGRVDVASSRREQYPAPGALPVVSPAPLLEDLRRRDFSVNAMAVALAPSAFGRLLDPLGGQRDLAAHRLRVLHPLSFVEDPTRIFRAARYAARLGFRLDSEGARALGLALRAGRYPALSGQRLWAELDLITVEAKAKRAFELLLQWRGLTIWNAKYRRSSRSLNRLAEAQRFGAWAHAAGIAVDRSEVALVALLMDQTAAVVSGSLHRLALTGEPQARLRAAVGAAMLARRLEREGRLSRVAEVLAGRPVTVLAGAWLGGGGRARRRIEWFLSQGRAVRPLLSGEDIVALGVPRGPQIGACLAALRRARLDGALATVAQERNFVKEWLIREEA